ncbi:hypothetical protein HanXRQr2_Chr03g0115091 [Helianthus annuus]|uniref:Uncharacterized protein n=1 Tax=Helianthus annuus TaxID=4232 RepID=A0A9K3NVG5_HELAN|nr:hypothetical protein HanXRQr2_Chr03g0115091 [Helianthus annuus]KAJ0601223.1 hypothetical protein HanIR_Chr03g0125921 [Helianthus annuus]KAJ0944027.1 hypothetical protein HanPSC8_Chr03g0111481 [Helianthus annuus]
MQVTLGEEGSGFSNPDPFFFPVAGNMAGEAAPLMLRLVLSRRLREVVRPVRPGDKIDDLEGSFMEEEWWREVKQMKRSLVVVGRCGGGGGRSESIVGLLLEHVVKAAAAAAAICLSWCMNIIFFLVDE